MKKIICFGDSNTFGYNPQNCQRYDENTRWTGVLAKILGSNCAVVEEGCNNRTAFFSNPDGILQSGKDYLPICLNNNKDFDTFILALGTNDLQFLFPELSEDIVANGLKYLVGLIRQFNNSARILVVSPVILSENILKGYFKCQFDEKSVQDSKEIQKNYKKFAKEEKIQLIDLNDFVKPSCYDGLHYDADSHKIIAEQIAFYLAK